MSLTFVRLHEVCDWEGESWDFWLQLTGNETELAKFDELLSVFRREADRVGYDFSYTFHPEDVEAEGFVDKLVEYAMPGYMDSANKVVGKFTCPDTLGEYADDLYKGGIRDYFTAELG